MSIMYLDMILSPLMTQPSGKGVYPHWKFPKEELRTEHRREHLRSHLNNAILSRNPSFAEARSSQRQVYHTEVSRNMQKGIEERRTNV